MRRDGLINVPGKVLVNRRCRILRQQSNALGKRTSHWRSSMQNRHGRHAILNHDLGALTNARQQTREIADCLALRDVNYGHICDITF
jgi:hypothetical protein